MPHWDADYGIGINPDEQLCIVSRNNICLSTDNKNNMYFDYSLNHVDGVIESLYFIGFYLFFFFFLMLLKWTIRPYRMIFSLLVKQNNINFFITINNNDMRICVRNTNRNISKSYKYLLS